MSTLKRVLAFSGLTGLLGALAFAVPASADVKGDCVVVGHAKTTDKVDSQLGVRLVSGKGTFTFNQVNLVCVGTSKGVPVVNPPLVVNGTQGWFQNTVCGTGKAVGTVEAAGEPKVAPAVDGEKFAVEFVASTGVFYWHDWDKPDVNTKPVPEDPGSAEIGTKDTNLKNYTAAGVVHLSPSETKPTELPNVPPGSCTKGFHVEGSVAVDFA